MEKDVRDPDSLNNHKGTVRTMVTPASKQPLTKSQLAKRLGVSRTYITLICQGKRQPSQQLVNKARQLMLAHDFPEEIKEVFMELG